jgi:quercetin dioxygenase-like cupin family protein
MHALPINSKEEIIKLVQRALSFTVFFLMTTIVASVWAQEPPARRELSRVGLSGAPGMEVVLSLSEYKPGDELPAHFHSGVEARYVLDGGMLEVVGKPACALPTGKPIMNLRDVPHGGFKVVGDKTIRLLTVHIVDKGEALCDSVKNMASSTDRDTALPLRESPNKGSQGAAPAASGAS